jgi:AcrR family transcriptional regulator
MSSTLVAQPETRTERKRRKTRDRLVSAAEKLMTSRPIDDVQIKHITETADVGHGTFYLHFKSKYDILVPIVRSRAVTWDHAIQQRVADMEDPAELMVFSGRHMSRLIQRDPIWRWFLKHAGVPVDEMRAAIGPFTARDFAQAVRAGRFNIPDEQFTSRFLFGAYVSSLLESFEASDPERVIDLMMELVLRVLGLDDHEAAEMAHCPLKPL